MTRGQRKIDPYRQLQVPLKRGQFRDQKYVKAIVLRMGRPFLSELDTLCRVNDRSRREIVEMLIAQAASNLRQDPGERITPL